MKIGLFGNGMDRMPDVAFMVMSAIFKVRDKIFAVDKLLDQFEIRKGQTVVDYGCGPGSYIKKASQLVGDNGQVIAVDIHELAIKSVEKRISNENLTNITGHVAENGVCPLADRTADVIYALDMFHMVSDPGSFLQELRRISKPSGFLFIDNGHQSRHKAREKIIASKKWEIIDENNRFMKCRPIL
jgi:ubiquinone/menaquinone biosynthesis C-methylase UbiE